VINLGTAEQALYWAINKATDVHECWFFLNDWEDGNIEEWPEYSKWLDEQ
jgi:hypothetical protein